MRSKVLREENKNCNVIVTVDFNQKSDSVQITNPSFKVAKFKSYNILKSSACSRTAESLPFLHNDQTEGDAVRWRHWELLNAWNLFGVIMQLHTPFRAPAGLSSVTAAMWKNQAKPRPSKPLCKPAQGGRDCIYHNVFTRGRLRYIGQPSRKKIKGVWVTSLQEARNALFPECKLSNSGSSRKQQAHFSSSFSPLWAWWQREN